MKVKVSELQGAALDWAVAQGEGVSLESFMAAQAFDEHAYQYSSGWHQGGPIIERESISVLRLDDDWGRDDKGYCNHVRIPVWAAACGQQSSWRSSETGRKEFQIEESEVVRGSSPLEAAMRCYVASKMGDEIEIPDELVK